MCWCDILQWNCKGLRTRAEELIVLLRDSNPVVICLQEAKLVVHRQEGLPCNIC